MFIANSNKKQYDYNQYYYCDLYSSYQAPAADSPSGAQANKASTAADACCSLSSEEQAKVTTSAVGAPSKFILPSRPASKKTEPKTEPKPKPVQVPVPVRAKEPKKVTFGDVSPSAAPSVSPSAAPSVSAAMQQAAIKMPYDDLISSAGALIHQGGASTELALEMLAARAFGAAMEEDDEDLHAKAEYEASYSIVEDIVNAFKAGNLTSMPTLDDMQTDMLQDLCVQENISYSTLLSAAAKAKAEAKESVVERKVSVPKVSVQEGHKEVYSRVLKEVGDVDFYTTPFLKLAEKYGEKYFPKVFAAFAESHPDSEFNIGHRSADDDEGVAELADYFVNPDTLKHSSLGMITTDFAGRVKRADIDSVEKLSNNLDELRLDFLTNEQKQMLVDLIQTDPDPYWVSAQNQTGKKGIKFVSEELKANTDVVNAALKDLSTDLSKKEKSKEKLALETLSDDELYYLLKFAGSVGGFLNNTADLIFEELVSRHPDGVLEKANHEAFLRFFDENSSKDWATCWSRPASVVDDESKVNPTIRNLITLFNYC